MPGHGEADATTDDGSDVGRDDPSDDERDDVSAPNRRGALARLGAAAAVASIAGCVDGDGGGGGDDDGASGDDGPDDGSTDGSDDEPPSNGPAGPATPEQRAIELRAILKEFEDGYEQSVLDRAEQVRRRHRDSVVFVNLQSQPVPHRLATGWFVGPGQVLTVEGKLGSLSTVPVHTLDGEEHEAEIVERHSGVENLALLELAVDGTPIDRSLYAGPPAPNEPLVQIGHHDEYGHWVATVGDFLRTQPYDGDLIDEHRSNTPGLPGRGGAPVFDLDGNLVGMTIGAVPREERGAGEVPRPLNDYVYDWQMSHREWFIHLDAIETFEEVESWL